MCWMKINRSRPNCLLKRNNICLTWGMDPPEILIFQWKNCSITFTPDKPMNDTRMILGNDTPCPQKG